MNEYDRVFACLDDLIEIANRPQPHSLGERAVDPYRFIAFNQVASDEIASSEVFMTSDGDEILWYPIFFFLHQSMGHVFDEAGLAATGRSLEQDRQTAVIRGLEDFDFVANGEIVRYG